MGTNERRRKLIQKQALILIVCVVLIALGISLFMRWWRVSELVQVQFVMPDGKTSPMLYLEIANTAAKRARGLMYRKELNDNGGMIFVFPSEAERSFWMKDTYIPLDMIHVGRDLKVVGFLENRPILSEEGKGVGKPAQYVVEVKAGLAKKWGLQTGARLEFKSALPTVK